jgi:hypothetical protein
MISVRTFLNSDPPEMARVLSAHFHAIGLDASVTGSQLDQAVFSRLLFDPAQLLVAVDDALGPAPVGFCHWTAMPKNPEASAIASGVSVAQLCIGEHPQRQAVSHALLQRAEQHWLAESVNVAVGGALQQHFGPYLGLPPVAGLIGIPDCDRETAAWFVESGFVPCERWELHVLELDQLRAPLDRELLQLRRQCTVQPIDLPLPTDRRRAIALASFDIEGFTLVEPKQPNRTHILEYWLDDPAFGPTGTAGVLLGSLTHEGATDGRFRLLLAESLRLLANQRRSRVQTAIPLGSKWAPFLAALGFKASGLGVIFQKHIRPPEPSKQATGSL